MSDPAAVRLEQVEEPVRCPDAAAQGRMTMHPFEKVSTDLPPGVSPHLDGRLKPGWRFDRRRRALVSGTGQSVSL